MGFQGPPAVDFYSQLSGLGDTLQANAVLRQRQQLQAARQGAFSDFTALDPNSPDYGKQSLSIAQKLGAAGDQEGAVKFLTLAQQSADRQHQYQREGVSDQHWAITDRRAAAAEGRAARDYENTPDQYVPNPRAAEPGQPKFIDQYAEAKTAAEAAAEAANPTKFSTTPIYGVDDSGKPVIMQAGRNGQLTKSVMPEGVSLSGNSPDSIKTRATRYLDTGDDTIINPRNFSGPQGQIDYRALQNEIERQRTDRGMRPDEISSNKVDYKATITGAGAAARTKAVRETNLDLILRAADAAIPAALEANKELPRSDFMPLNKLIQKGQVMTSDPRLLKFGMANLQLAEHWARAMNPTGVMRESDRDKALTFLNTAYGNGTYEQGVGQLRTQIEREKKAVNDVDADHKKINGGRPVRVSSPDDASMYPSGTKILIPNGSGGFDPGVVP